jgi:hypothetical protein
MTLSRYAGLLSLCGVVGCGTTESEGVETLGSVEAPIASSQESQKLFASDGVSGDQFGTKVSTDGTTLVIGARFADYIGPDNGAAYVYTRTGSTWTFVQRLTSNTVASTAGEFFGASVAVEGNTIVIGAHKADKAPQQDCGAFYVFQNTNGVWAQVQKVWAPDNTAHDHLGWSISLENGTILVGAPEDDDKGTDSGSIYFYTLSGSTATYTGKLYGADTVAGDAFGKSLDRDGNTLIAGATGHDTPSPFGGAAYVFTLSGSTWTQEAKLSSPDITLADQFGFGVSASGNRVLVSAIGSDAKGSDSGAAYVFLRGANGAWTEEKKLTASDGAALDNLGRGLSLEGNVAVIGSVGKDTYGAYSGAAYLYSLGANGWTEDQKLFASDPAVGARFGFWVEGNGSGEFIIVADQADGAMTGTGAAYVHTVTTPFDCTSAPDGTACDDGDLCTAGESCQAGYCVAGSAVVCPAPTACQASNTCDATTGQCLAVAAADGTACTDGDSCTGPDTCQAGACVAGTGGDDDSDGLCNGVDNCPSTFNPSQLDLNGDGSGDACVTSCLIYQRGTSGTVIDAAVQVSLPSTNFGAVTSLLLGLNGALTRSALQADISAIPLGSTVVSATLALTTSTVAGAGTISVHRTSAAWAENTLNWNNLVFAANVDASTTVSGLGTASFDLTALAQQWLNGTYPNQGITLEEDSSGGAKFRSSEFVTVSARPKLTLCYLAPAQ